MWKCSNCEKTGDIADIEYKFPNIPDLLARIEPGGTVPDGECPCCGALVYDDDSVPNQAQRAPLQTVKGTEVVGFYLSPDHVVNVYISELCLETENPVLTLRAGDEAQGLIVRPYGNTAIQVTTEALGFRKTRR